MNAYELADHLEKANYVGAIKAANMLRQQADRIAELEGEVSHLKHINKNWSISEGWALQRIAELEKVIQLNNEVLKPMLIDCIKRNLSVIDANLFFAKYDSVRGTKERITPQTKPLSDEEAINRLNNSLGNVGGKPIRKAWD